MTSYVRPEKRKYHYVYKITRTDGRYYIGMHSTDNIDDGYFGSGKLLWLSVKKHGRGAHTKSIIKMLDSRAGAADFERSLVSETTLQDPLCFNLRLGGDVGTFTDDIRKKISVAKKGKSLSEATKRKMSEQRIGKTKSEEHRLAISAAHQGKKGHPHTDEAKRKISEAGKGRVVSASAREKLSAATRGTPKARIACPFCHKVGGNSNMRRYHFENCRSAALSSQV